MAYRLVPVKTAGGNFFSYGRINPEVLNENLMEKFSWGGVEKDDVYIGHQNKRTFSVIQFRNRFIRLAEAWLEKGEKEKAIAALDRCMELSPNSKIPYDFNISGISFPGQNGTISSQNGIIEMYFKCGAGDKAKALLEEYKAILEQDLVYYDVLNSRQKERFNNEFYQSRGIYEQLIMLEEKYN